MIVIARSLVKGLLGRHGYEVQRVGTAQASTARLAFNVQSTAINRAHREQTLETVAALKQKYERPVLGSVDPWRLLELLAQCVDPTDVALGCTSQQVHVLQVLQSMEDDGIDDPDMLTAALIHDVGKVLLLTGEAPENVVCYNDPVGEYPPGFGLDNCVFQWNHDEFAYSRFKDLVPEPVAWLLRYHSIRLDRCEPLMDERDLRYMERYLRPFQKHDSGSKSAYVIPRRPLNDYRDLLETALPKTLRF